MKKTFKYIIGILLIVVSLPVFAQQQRPVVSLYMLNGLVLNPAYAGRNEYSTFSAMYRDQWINFPGSPKLIVASAQTGLKGKNIGIGLQIANDAVGVHDNTSVYGSYAYNLKMINGGKLSLGLQAGFDYLRSDYQLVNKKDEADPYLTGITSDFMPNFGMGVFYHDDYNYVGISVPYILANKKFELEELYTDVRLARYYYITGGRLIQAGPRLVIKPSALIRIQDNNPLAFDLNINFYIDEIIGLGASYRYGDSMIGIFEFQMNDYLKFSYAYDYVLSDITYSTRGSHEMMLNYRINFSAPRKHRMCPGPSYF